MKTNPRGHPGFTKMELAVLILLILAVAVIAAPVLFRPGHRAPDRTEALNNIKQISVMLFEFDADYGSLPDDKTALEVKQRNKTDFTLTGQYSNDYFRQLLVGGGGKSEKPFWCKTAQSPKKNREDDFSSQAKTLEAGEVGFSYIMASPSKGQSANDEPLRPVVVAASDQFRADWTFDPDAFAGKAVVLRLDNSATPMQIRQNDKKVSTGVAGKTLGDSGDNTVWGSGVNPVLKAPQPIGKSK
ncbi:hypothetical protein [Haloferula sp. BvORR071]|uniref:hypothetical protein n=1 Tax=Haloferula sp. BvORR071 TaxID=1396141 RepID=UPI00055271E2|nr:hypothetical protein [Haloferula sp. BvORR071]